MNILKKIFSIKNEYVDFLETKIITILGIKFKFVKINNRGLLNKLKKYHTIEKFITGENNQIYSIDDDGNKIEITQKEKGLPFYIKGDNNRIIFHRSKENLDILPKGLIIKIKGSNNNIEIYEPNFADSMIYMYKDNNSFSLGPTTKEVWGAYFNIERGASITIEENCELGNGKFRCFANGDYLNKHKVVIRKGTHIAHDVVIRNSDGECIIDPITKEGLSEPQDIIIGENCWITTRSTILKGVTLPPNTIVASNSLVNKKFEKEYTLIGGIPARILKEDIYWVPHNYGEYMEMREKEQSESEKV